MRKYIKINEDDNVAVALCPLKKDENILDENFSITLLEDIPQGHKIALTDINKDQEIIKYGNRIGYASKDIKKGQWVHVHNVVTALGDKVEYTYEPVEIQEIEKRKLSFMGYRRKDGTVGVRNEIWIVPTVGCVNSVAKHIADEAKKRFKLNNIDDIVSFSHPYGCSQMGDDQENTRHVLSNIIRHPNAGGVLVLGLGCENCNIPVLKDYLDGFDESRVKFLQCQDYDDEIEESLSVIKELCDNASKFEREECDASELIIGMKCGGSDGLSGITANPVVGSLSDLVISAGGTTILTEVPEMFGAETILMNRCKDKEIFGKTVSLINDFKDYYVRHNQTIYENPSPGNKKGGITTLEDKSTGCIQKSGSTNVVDVLSYAERVKEKGLNLLCAPGNDLVASTALAVSGAQIVLFTTGRGTPFASLVPTVKISSNTTLANKKSNWIDFNAGTIVEDKTKKEVSEELLEYVLSVASGKHVKAEESGYHDIAIFKQGVTL